TGGTRPGATGRRPGQQGRKPASRGIWPSWFAPAGRKTVKKPAGRPAAKKTTARPISRPTAPGPGPVTPPTGGRPNVASPTTTPQAPPCRNRPATGTDQEGAPRVFGRKWKENAEEVRSQAARYDPDAMPEYLTDCKDLTEAFEVEADAIGKFAAVS